MARSQQRLPGSARRHLGGKQAARTRRHNQYVLNRIHHPVEGINPEQRPPGHISTDPPPTIINGVIQYTAPPADGGPPKFGTPGKFICPHCHAQIGWEHKEEHLVFDCPTINPPTPPRKVQKDSPKPSDDIKSKFHRGDKVWINGYGNCKIKTNRVKRFVEEVRLMPSGIFYRAFVGTNSTGGFSYHWYPESRLILISPWFAPPPTALMIRPSASIVIHPFVRSNYANIEIKKLDVKVLGKISLPASTQSSVPPSTPQPTAPRTPTAKSRERKSHSPIQRTTPQSKTESTQSQSA